MELCLRSCPLGNLNVTLEESPLIFNGHRNTAAAGKLKVPFDASPSVVKSTMIFASPAAWMMAPSQ
jgi:hypothetical protein